MERIVWLCEAIKVPCPFLFRGVAISSHHLLHESTSMEHFMDLKAAQIAMELIEEVYCLCRKLPREETYGLCSQLKRASTSILANIAEGFGRFTYSDKGHHYTIARGECSEVVAHLFVAVHVHLLSDHDVRRALALADHVGKLLSGLILSSRKRSLSRSL